MTCGECSPGMQFNSMLQMCLFERQEHYTNLHADHIFYNGDFSDVTSIVREAREDNLGASECHISRPYYSRRLNQCINCPASAPLFDFRRNQCIQCPPGTRFSTYSHICQSQSVSPTLERMIMNSS